MQTTLLRNWQGLLFAENISRVEIVDCLPLKKKKEE